MLAQAHVKGVYDTLYEGDLINFMHASDKAYDAIVSAGTLIHFGDLSPVLKASSAALQERGCLAFTTFSNDDVDPRGYGPSPKLGLAKAGCFAHGSNYLRTVAAETGFEAKLIEAIPHEHNEEEVVSGFVCVLHSTAH